MAVRVEIQGLPQLRAALTALGNKADSGLSAALFQEAHEILNESKNQVPVYSGPPRKGVIPGALKNSGHVSLPQRTAHGTEVTIGYGGAAEAYAWVQHERRDFKHRVGKAKYLEDPMRAAAPGLAARLAGRLRGFLQ